MRLKITCPSARGPVPNLMELSVCVCVVSVYNCECEYRCKCECVIVSVGVHNSKTTVCVQDDFFNRGQQ